MLHHIEMIVKDGAPMTLLILNMKISMAWIRAKLVTWVSKIKS